MRHADRSIGVSINNFADYFQNLQLHRVPFLTTDLLSLLIPKMRNLKIWDLQMPVVHVGRLWSFSILSRPIGPRAGEPSIVRLLPQLSPRSRWGAGQPILRWAYGVTWTIGTWHDSGRLVPNNSDYPRPEAKELISRASTACFGNGWSMVPATKLKRQSLHSWLRQHTTKMNQRRRPWTLRYSRTLLLWSTTVEQVGRLKVEASQSTRRRFFGKDQAKAEDARRGRDRSNSL